MALTNYPHRTYGPDSVGVIRQWWVASLRDAYDIERINTQSPAPRGLVDAPYFDVSSRLGDPIRSHRN